MRTLRKVILTLMWAAPLPVALYCFVVDQALAGIGAAALAVVSAFIIGMSKAFADRFGEDMLRDAKKQAAEEERRRLRGIIDEGGRG